MKHQTLIAQMTLPDKIALCSGADSFTTKAFAQYGIPSIRMADGPHGLRKALSTADDVNINNSVPATCFPTACLTACSWDRDLLREMGAAIGEEAQQEGVSIVLGPGVNIKRNPLCGRNFEYFSEDPFLAGEMAASWIEGLQRQGVGASLKHFAANNQENERMSSDSVIDERTLREIYLPAFERAVKHANPATVMCAYNKLNGTYCSDHLPLLRTILRDEWDWHGVIMTDWGALNDRVEAFRAGLDLEMPYSGGYFDQAVLAAIQSGALPESCLDECVDRLLDLVMSAAANRRTDYRYDAEQHHLLAKKIAASSAVLLKNEGNILPLDKGKRITLIGEMAKEPRYQGAGSSHVNPTRLSSAVDGLTALGLPFTYYPGYALKGSTPDALIEEAVAGARAADVVVILAGLPAGYESEGYDRVDLTMPEGQNALIARVAEANPNTVVVLSGGAPMEMPWLSSVKAVLHLYLAGQAGGLAAAELLAGVVNPSGKLAESYPLSYADVPSAGFWETGGKQAQYREAIHVGYRYYDKARKQVLFPFGHGLSYTTCEYQELALSTTELQAPYELTVTCTVKNTGEHEGAEIVQLYVGQLQPSVFRPERELKAFAKVFLQPGEARRVSWTLDARSFAIYSPEAGDWVVPGGVYQISIGASSRDLRLQAEVKVHGQPIPAEAGKISDWYLHPAGRVTQQDFESLLGRKIEQMRPPRKGQYTTECTLEDMRGSFLVRLLLRIVPWSIGRSIGGADYDDPTFRMILTTSVQTPLKNLSQLSAGRLQRHVAQGLVDLANGKYLRGLMRILRKPGKAAAKKP